MHALFGDFCLILPDKAIKAGRNQCVRAELITLQDFLGFDHCVVRNNSISSFHFSMVDSKENIINAIEHIIGYCHALSGSDGMFELGAFILDILW